MLEDYFDYRPKTSFQISPPSTARKFKSLNQVYIAKLEEQARREYLGKREKRKQEKRIWTVICQPREQFCLSNLLERGLG